MHKIESDISLIFLFFCENYFPTSTLHIFSRKIVSYFNNQFFIDDPYLVIKRSELDSPPLGIEIRFA